MGSRHNVWTVAVFLGVAPVSLFGCDFTKIQKCHDEMKVSQDLMLQLSEKNREDLAFAEKTHGAVKATLAACVAAKRGEEVAKITQAEREIAAHVKALKERAAREKLPKLSAAELLDLEKGGDPSCPMGQQYEHHQNKKRIKCRGPQIVEMNWKRAAEYFDRRGFLKHPKGSTLRVERGAQVIDFQYKTADSTDRAECVTIVADPGIPWQETVTRATGVHPRHLTLGKPVVTKKGELDLLVEGGPEQYTVKLGQCQPTPGQKPVTEPEAPAP